MLGIGLNVAVSLEDLPPELRSPPLRRAGTGAREPAGRDDGTSGPRDVEPTLARLIAALELPARRARRRDSSTQWRARDALPGEGRSAGTGGEGRAAGIDGNGRPGASHCRRAAGASWRAGEVHLALADRRRRLDVLEGVAALERRGRVALAGGLSGALPARCRSRPLAPLRRRRVAAARGVWGSCAAARARAPAACAPCACERRAAPPRPRACERARPRAARPPAAGPACARRG